MNIVYKGEELILKEDFCGEPVLWIRRPSQIKMEHMKFVGGKPDEYCITLSDIGEYKLLIGNDRKAFGFILKEDKQYVVYIALDVTFAVDASNINEAEMKFWKEVKSNETYKSIISQWMKV